MKKVAPLSVRWTGLLTAKAIRGWMSTLDYRVFYYDQQVDPCWGTEQPRIYVFWHEYILVPLYLRPHCDLVMLLSRHRDADVLERVAHHVGFGVVRGSSSRGAASALLEMARLDRKVHLTITPDGPRGPRRHMATGAVFLASKLGMPIVPLGFGLSRPWRMRSWDRFALPRPFSRARAVVGPALWLPTDLDRTGMENSSRQLQQLLNDLTCEAETWAESGGARHGELITGLRTRDLTRQVLEQDTDGAVQHLQLVPRETTALRRSA